MAYYKAVLLTLCSLTSLAFLFQSCTGQTCGPAIGGNCGTLCCSQFGYCGASCDYCGAGCQSGYGRCGGCDCFPASAMVTTRSGVTKPVSALSIGEEVTVRNRKGVMEYDSVYALAHADPEAVSQFLVLTLTSLQNPNVTQTLQLTPRHFTIVQVQGLDNKLKHKVASSVRVGDRMLANHNPHDPHFSTFVVSGIEKQIMRGLYKPLTLKGTIVVNNVLASCFSQWYLHSALEHIFGVDALPSIYQAIFTPMRMAYMRMDKDVYAAVYSKLDLRSVSSILAKSGDNLKGFFHLLMGAVPSPLA